MGLPAAEAGRVLRAARVAAGILAAISTACGGTTGRERLPSSMTTSDNTGGDAGDGSVDGTLADDGGDATLQDSGTEDFDVAISYTDRVLPDISVTAPQVEAGEDGSVYPWPSCPPFLPVRGDKVVGFAEATNEVPSVYTDDGGLAFAPDGSACASYGWFGTPAIDECTTMNEGNLDSPAFPPCNWCANAGFVSQGTMAGQSRYSVCLDLYQCILQTGCGANGIGSCLCGSESTATCASDMNPPGPCAQLELASLEERPDSIEDALDNYIATGPPFLGVCGSTLNNVFASANSGGCFPSEGGSP